MSKYSIFYVFSPVTIFDFIPDVNYFFIVDVTELDFIEEVVTAYIYLSVAPDCDYHWVTGYWVEIVFKFDSTASVV